MSFGDLLRAGRSAYRAARGAALDVAMSEAEREAEQQAEDEAVAASRAEIRRSCETIGFWWPPGGSR